jgi:catechol 2,3-dioxygenase-like lactoylglutathione lyase family enzyme
VIAVRDVAWVRYQAPDLDAMERFLLDFGLLRAHRTATTLFMRTRGPLPYAHVTDLGAPRCLAFALIADGVDALHALSRATGAPVQPNPEPAGGAMVQLVDPSGFDVTVVADLARADPLPTRAPHRVNTRGNPLRLGAPARFERGPSQVLRLGHVALRVKDLEGSLRFYTELLGMRIADSAHAGDNADHIAGHFLRCGLGEQYTDHHTIALFKRPESCIDHSAFEVLDWDDLMMGHQHLATAGHRRQWGIGRHVEGSQVFDYWRDPCANKIEHWTDGDLVNDRHEPGLVRLSAAGLSQWAPPLPPDFYA